MDTVQWIMSIGTNLFEAIKLNDDLSSLRTSLPKSRLLIDQAEWGRFKNKDLALLLSQLKDTTCDAEDLLRKFDDQMLRQNIEDADRSRAGQFFSSSLNLANNLISRSKGRVKEAQIKLDKAVAELEAVLNFIGLNAEPVQLMPETSSVISVTEVLGRDKERDQVIEMMGVTIGRDDARDQVIGSLGVPLTRGRSARPNGKREVVHTHVTSKSRANKRVKGERSQDGHAAAPGTKCTSDVSVLVIVGIGGVGKTTLAQFIYNDARVKAHFDVRLWVCVSDLFNTRRITKEIIESVTGEEFNSSRSLDTLQVKLKEQLMGRKFLLVLDDMWPDANNEWEAFYAPLRHGLESSTVLVTTRFLTVASLVTTVKPVQLEGLPADIFWDFFKKFAFGKEDPNSYPQLQYVGQNIANKLCRSPLAAKTLGRLLNMELTERHWRIILNNELWDLPHQESDILPALQLSYLYLPPELKRCFALCSMFPKNYSFKRDEIVGIWVAEGLVTLVAPGGSMCLEDTGFRYLDDLRGRFLFQTDPKFPGRSRYVMHDLIHDMAQSVSVDECFVMQDSSNQNQRRMPHAVRHMSIEVRTEALRKMTGLHHLNKLNSLRFGNRLEFEIPGFNQLSNILFLCLKGCKLVELPENICYLNNLRYLDISHSTIQEIPKKFWRLYNLQVLDAACSNLQTIHDGVTKLVNLRHLALPAKVSQDLSKISGLGNLSSLRYLSHFIVGTENGRRIDELKGMNQLSGRLCIRSISKVENMTQAAEASLVEKQYLKGLVLQWRRQGCHLRSSENKVLEALRPPSGIECLKVQGFGGDNFSPSWLKSENLTTIRSLELSDCYFFKYLSIPFHSLEQLKLCNVRIASINSISGTARIPLSKLTSLSFVRCRNLTNLEQFLSPKYLPSIKFLLLEGCSSLVSLPVHNFDGSMQPSSSSSSSGIRFSLTNLTALHLIRCYKLTNVDQFLSAEYLPFIKSIDITECTGLVSLPVHNFAELVYLEDMKIHNCSSLVCPSTMILPSSLQQLSLCNAGEFDKSFRLESLQNLTCLTLLHLEGCPNVESLLLNSIKLKCLFLCRCPELSSVGGSHALSSINYIDISYCPKLTIE